ncbi:hypothetical protein QBC42DRAFT_217192 [Cladorrhinum samala]|uniref:C2H2-type domain-containing protein n=1 Tax=Cladorrhinum samala TaxID=585594 RepID=A0AAV9I0X2_9PEZI|nr:hypothetical protein QBC42DRAFT_217192 [Cladorrhinum samala]
MADDTTFCRPCQRDFRTEKSLLQHRQNSGQHVYDCLRCDKHFASASAKEQHRNNSRNHYICYPCDFDSSSQDGLDQHDIDVHNTCGTCGLGFAFPSSLKTHHLTAHAKREIVSPGCFTPNDGASFDDEFSRLALSQKWAPGSRQYSEQRAIAICAEFKSQFFSSSQPKLKGYQDLCSEFGVPPGESIKECLARLKSIYVNIVDLINARRMGVKAKQWDDFEAFRNYTLQRRNRIPREVAKKAGGGLASLLQYLYNPQRKKTRVEKTNGWRAIKKR